MEEKPYTRAELFVAADGFPQRGLLCHHCERRIPQFTDLSEQERDTTAPFWTNSRRVGKVTSYTMSGMSKDNFFFGVRAIDREGHRSPVSYPRPVR